MSAVGGIGTAVVAVNDHLIAFPGRLNGILPGKVQFFLSVTANKRHGLFGESAKAMGKRLGVFFDQQAVAFVGDAFGSTASGNQDRSQGTGGRFPHHQTIGIKGGGEEKQVSPAVPGTKGLPLVDGTCKKHLFGQTKLF